MRSVQRFRHLQLFLFLLQGHRQEQRTEVRLLRGKDVWQVRGLLRLRPVGGRFLPATPVASQGLLQLQRLRDLQFYLLLLQGHGQEQRTEVRLL